MRRNTLVHTVLLASLMGCPEDADERDLGDASTPDGGTGQTSDPAIGADAGRDAGAADAATRDAALEDARAEEDGGDEPDASLVRDAAVRADAGDDAGRVIEGGTCHPGNGILAGGGRAFGFCQGECKFELVFVFPTVPIAQSCLTPQVNLVVSNQPGTDSKTTTAYLTEAAWQRAAEIGYALRDVELKPSYGCPDCADGGSATLVLDSASKGLIDTVYEFRKPPAVLVEADTFVQGLIEQLQECAGKDIVGCVAP